MLFRSFLRGRRDGNSSEVEQHAALARFGKVGEVQRQAVADVDSSMDPVTRRQSGGLAHARYRVQVATQQAASVFAGCENHIADLSSGSAPDAVLQRSAVATDGLRFPDRGNADHESIGPGVGIAPGDRNRVFLGEGQQAFDDFLSRLQTSKYLPAALRYQLN